MELGQRNVEAPCGMLNRLHQPGGTAVLLDAHTRAMPVPVKYVAEPITQRYRRRGSQPA